VRLIFFGTGDFALPALQALAPHVVLVVTQPPRPKGRGMKLQPSPIHLLAEQLQIPVQAPEKARAPEFVQLLQEAKADALVVASYGQILSQAVLDSAVRGGINLHGSILPEYRGAAPIQRSILDGKKETGVTLMQMDKGMDTGDIIEIARTPIDPDETYGELQTRLSHIASNLISNWITRIVAGNYPRQPQNSDQATLAPKIQKEETELNVAKPAQDEYNRFRAFTPNPGVSIQTNQGLLKISKAHFSTLNGDPGIILNTKEALTLAFQEGAIELLEVQPEGKKRMSGRDFANGARLKVGERLVSLT
jgi:methionyl-tRNA formyltransferase